MKYLLLTITLLLSFPAAGFAQQLGSFKGITVFTGATPPNRTSVGVHVHQPRVLASAKVKRILTPFIGTAITDPAVQQIRNTVVDALVEAGYPFARVYFPAQDIRSRVLLVGVLHGTPGEIRAQGNTHFDDAYYTSRIRAAQGQPIHKPSLDDDLRWISRNPFVGGRIETSAGTAPGLTDLTVQADERKPRRWTFSADNTGSQATGLYRFGLGFQHGNLTGVGDQFSYDLSVSDQPDRLISHSAGYVLPLANRNELQLSVSVSPTEVPVLGPFVSRETRFTTAARYVWPNLQTGAESWGEISYSRSDGDVRFGNTVVSSRNYDLVEFAVGRSAVMDIWSGRLSYSASLHLSPGGLGRRNSNGAVAGSATGATARYGYAKANATYERRFSNTSVWSTAVFAQIASGSLPSPVRITVAGPSAVRGFASGQVGGDMGLFARNSYSLAPFVFSIGARQGEVIPFAHLDAGVAHTAATGQNTVYSSVGLGAHFKAPGFGILSLTLSQPTSGPSRVLQTQASFSVSF